MSSPDSELIYIASPYSHVEARIRVERFEIAKQVTATLLKRGRHIFSPIVYSHTLAVEFELPKDFTFWESLDYEFVERATELWVINMPGWNESKGVYKEVKRATDCGIPCYLYTYSFYDEKLENLVEIDTSITAFNNVFEEILSGNCTR